MLANLLCMYNDYPLQVYLLFHIYNMSLNPLVMKKGLDTDYYMHRNLKHIPKHLIHLKFFSILVNP